MPRRARIAVANYPHHRSTRHNRRVVFVTDPDRLTYLATLREFRAELDLKIYGYCDDGEIIIPLIRIAQSTAVSTEFLVYGGMPAT